jgi:hypothetical protein
VNLTGDTLNDQVALKGTSGGGLSVAYREGNAVGAGLPGATYGSSMSDVGFSNAGLISMRATSLGGTTAPQNAAILRNDGANLSSQANNAAVRPSGVGARDWASFDFGTYWVDGTGTNWITRGTLTGDAASNQLLAVNNAAVIQEGMALGSFANGVSSIISNNMTSNGDWFARGENLVTDQAWVVRNGTVIVDSDDAVPGGLVGETFTNSVWNVSSGNTFFMHTGNNVGDYLYGGFTNNADTTRQAVWVLNGSQVVLREGDQVDLDGDGLLDDAFIDVTGLTGASLDNKVDGAFLTDDLWMYFTADLRNGAGADIGEAFLRIQVPEPTALAGLALAGLLLARRRA